MALQKPPRDPQLQRNPDDPPHTLRLDARAVAELGTHAWKARRRLEKISGAELPGDLARLQRHLDGILDSLSSLGLQIKDHTGEQFDYGQSLTVVASQPRANITQEIVAETIRPTIYLQGHRIQQGEVVIYTPIGTKD